MKKKMIIMELLAIGRRRQQVEGGANRFSSFIDALRAPSFLISFSLLYSYFILFYSFQSTFIKHILL